MKTETTLQPAILELNLSITDPAIISYLFRVHAEDRESKALDALRIGVLAIQSAGTAIDSSIVEEKFRDLNGQFNGHLDELRKDLDLTMREHLDEKSGTLPRSLDKVFGDNGVLSAVLKSYMSPDGKLTQLMKEQIGPGSEFAKQLDPRNKDSVISLLESKVQEHLQTKTQEIMKQFSLDEKDSSISRLSAMVAEQISGMKNENARFFNEVKEALGFNKGKKQEAEKGTEKGREFEVKLYEDFVAPLALQLEDAPELLRGTPGSVARCKKGDYVITLGESSAAPGKKIVMEVKNGDNYDFSDAMDELQIAKENRGAQAGIFVFTKGNEPSETGDFRRIGNDIYVTVDEEKLSTGEPLMFLETAYKICRAMIAASARAGESDTLDLTKIRSGIELSLEQVGLMADIITKAQTISRSSTYIESTAKNVRDAVNEQLEDVMEMLNYRKV